MYRKSKKYTRYGGYLTAFLWYITAAFYYNSWPNEKAIVIGMLAFSVIVSIITIGLWNTKRNSDLTNTSTSKHDIAVLIDAYDQEGHEGLVKEYDQLDGYIDENKLLSEARKSSFESYMKTAEDRGEDFVNSTIIQVFEVIIRDMDSVLKNEIPIPEDESNTTTVGKAPSRTEVVLSALNPEHWNSNLVFWGIFSILALVGIGVALWRGEVWGVLVVTILFAALRYHDNRNT